MDAEQKIVAAAAAAAPMCEQNFCGLMEMFKLCLNDQLETLDMFRGFIPRRLVTVERVESAERRVLHSLYAALYDTMACTKEMAEAGDIDRLMVPEATPKKQIEHVRSFLVGVKKISPVKSEISEYLLRGTVDEEDSGLMIVGEEDVVMPKKEEVVAKPVVVVSSTSTTVGTLDEDKDETAKLPVVTTTTTAAAAATVAIAEKPPKKVKKVVKKRPIREEEEKDGEIISAPPMKKVKKTVTHSMSVGEDEKKKTVDPKMVTDTCQAVPDVDGKKKEKKKKMVTMTTKKEEKKKTMKKKTVAEEVDGVAKTDEVPSTKSKKEKKLKPVVTTSSGVTTTTTTTAATASSSPPPSKVVKPLSYDDFCKEFAFKFSESSVKGEKFAFCKKLAMMMGLHQAGFHYSARGKMVMHKQQCWNLESLGFKGGKCHRRKLLANAWCQSLDAINKMKSKMMGAVAYKAKGDVTCTNCVLMGTYTLYTKYGKQPLNADCTWQDLCKAVNRDPQQGVVHLKDAVIDGNTLRYCEGSEGECKGWGSLGLCETCMGVYRLEVKKFREFENYSKMPRVDNPGLYRTADVDREEVFAGNILPGEFKVCGGCFMDTSDSVLAKKKVTAVSSSSSCGSTSAVGSDGASCSVDLSTLEAGSVVDVKNLMRTQKVDKKSAKTILNHLNAQCNTEGGGLDLVNQAAVSAGVSDNDEDIDAKAQELNNALNGLISESTTTDGGNYNFYDKCLQPFIDGSGGDDNNTDDVAAKMIAEADNKIIGFGMELDYM